MIETSVSDPIYVISARGEWDMATAPAMQPALDQATSGKWPFVFVDLANVTFMDVAGSRPLREAVESCRDGQVRLYVVNPPAMIAKVLQVLGAGAAVTAIDMRDGAEPAAASAP